MPRSEEEGDDRPILRTMKEQRRAEEPHEAPLEPEVEVVDAAPAPSEPNKVPSVPLERMCVQVDVDEELGLKLTEQLVVEGFSRMTNAESRFCLLDRLEGINGKKIRNVGHFGRLVKKFAPHLEVVFFRPLCNTLAHQMRLDKHGLTEAVTAKNFPDDQFYVATISYRPGVHLGLAVASHQGVVVISRVDKDSLACRRFEIGDIVIDVNGETVRDKNDFKQLMTDSMDRCGFVTVLVHRPFSLTSLRIAKIALGATQKNPVDPCMPHDAMIIGRKEVQRLRYGEAPVVPKSILHDAPMCCTKIGFSSDKPAEYEIQSDTPDGAKLMRVPSRAELHARMLAHTKKKKKGKKDSSLVEDSMDTPAPPILAATTPPPPPQVSFFKRARDSLREKREKLFNRRKNSDSDSSSKKNRSKKQHAPEGSRVEYKFTEDVAQRKGKKEEAGSVRKKKDDSDRKKNADAASDRRKRKKDDDASDKAKNKKDDSDRRQKGKEDNGDRRRKH